MGKKRRMEALEEPTNWPRSDQGQVPANLALSTNRTTSDARAPIPSGPLTGVTAAIATLMKALYYPDRHTGATGSHSFPCTFVPSIQVPSILE